MFVSVFFFYFYGDHLHLPSFPTRLSADLSFASLSTPHLAKQVLEEHEIEQIRFKAILVTTSKQVNGTMPVVTTPVSQAIGPLKDAAAIKIQAAFRSYLVCVI